MDRSEIEKGFNKLARIADGASPEERLATARTIDTLWRAFNANYSNVPEFQELPEEMQAKWLENVLKFKEKVLREEKNRDLPFGSATGAFLMVYYFSALACKLDASVLNNMADVLEPYNKLAFGYRTS